MNTLQLSEGVILNPEATALDLYDGVQLRLENAKGIVDLLADATGNNPNHAVFCASQQLREALLMLSRPWELVEDDKTVQREQILEEFGIQEGRS